MRVIRETRATAAMGRGWQMGRAGTNCVMPKWWCSKIQTQTQRYSLPNFNLGHSARMQFIWRYRCVFIVPVTLTYKDERDDKRWWWVCVGVPFPSAVIYAQVMPNTQLPACHINHILRLIGVIWNIRRLNLASFTPAILPPQWQEFFAYHCNDCVAKRKPLQ